MAWSPKHDVRNSSRLAISSLEAPLMRLSRPVWQTLAYSSADRANAGAINLLTTATTS
jgi:hypothetical protein